MKTATMTTRITCIGLLIFFSTFGCGLIKRNIESVAELTIETDSHIIKSNDTVTFKFRIKNKSKTSIEISNYPGALFETWLNYTDTQYKQLRQLESLAYKPIRGGIDTSLYILIPPAGEFIISKHLFISCGNPETHVIATDSTMIEFGYPCGDTRELQIDGQFISASTGYDDGHFAVVGSLKGNEITVTVIPDKVFKHEQYVGTVLKITDYEY